MRIVHLSDPHFGTTTTEKIRALQDSVRQLRPQVVVLSGDITQRARAHQFREAQDFVASLSEFPFVVIPGNHDIPLFNLWARFTNPYGGFKDVFPGTIETRVQYGPIEVLGLASTSRFRHVQGHLSEKYLKGHWPESDADFRVLAFHHPMDCPKRVDVKNLLKNRDELLHFALRHKVDLILGGHIHDPYVSLSDTRYPDHPGRIVLVVGGTCLSSRTRADAPNSFNVLDMQPPRLEIHRMDLVGGSFRPVSQCSFLREMSRNWTRAENGPSLALS